MYLSHLKLSFLINLAMYCEDNMAGAVPNPNMNIKTAEAQTLSKLKEDNKAVYNKPHGISALNTPIPTNPTQFLFAKKGLNQARKVPIILSETGILSSKLPLKRAKTPTPNKSIDTAKTTYGKYDVKARLSPKSPTNTPNNVYTKILARLYRISPQVFFLSSLPTRIKHSGPHIPAQCKLPDKPKMNPALNMVI